LSHNKYLAKYLCQSQKVVTVPAHTQYKRQYYSQNHCNYTLSYLFNFEVALLLFIQFSVFNRKYATNAHTVENTTASEVICKGRYDYAYKTEIR